MTLNQFVCLFIYLSVSAHALKCWVCENARSNRECHRIGRLQQCRINERACQNVVRRGSFGILIYKRCKEVRACDNNFIQNRRAAWFPHQCNTRSPSSVCRCCCSGDGCNAATLACLQQQRADPPPTALNINNCEPPRAPRNGSMKCTKMRLTIPESSGRMSIGTTCLFSCSNGLKLTGAHMSRCGKWSGSPLPKFNRPTPFCSSIECPALAAPSNGEMTCSDGNRLGSVCEVACSHGYYLSGEKKVTCLANKEDDLIGTWSSSIGGCQAASCPLIPLLEKGTTTCSKLNLVESICKFACAPGYDLVGAAASQCKQSPSGKAEWTSPPPKCKAIHCRETPTPPPHGSMTCSNNSKAGSECSFRCNYGYLLEGNQLSVCGYDGLWNFDPPKCIQIKCSELESPSHGRLRCPTGRGVGSICSFGCDKTEEFLVYPPSHTNLTCLGSGNWNLEPPCCARQCPPFAVMDLILVLDSSSSIGIKNWGIMKKFVAQFINSFKISPTISRISVMRYNNDVDMKSLIMLGDHPNNKSALISALHQMPYDGTGTKTGKAVQFVSDVILKEENGDRVDVKDVVVVITDGRAQDGEILSKASSNLRKRGALTYAIGVEPKHRGRLDRKQLRDIAGSNKRIIIATKGFEGLDEQLLGQLSKQICENRCMTSIKE